MGNVWTTIPKKQDILFGINHDNIVDEIKLDNWETKAVCHVDQESVIYAYITKYKNNKKARFDVRVYRGFSKSATEFKDSFDNLGDAIEAVNARKGKMAQTLMLPAHPSQYPSERGADIEIFGINTNEHGHRVGQVLGRIPTKLEKKQKGERNV
jgi:hypothetical protein